MVTPPRSPPQSDGNTEPQPKKTRQSTRLRRLTLRSLDQPRPTVTVDPATGRASGQEKQKFHSFLGVVARKKIPNRPQQLEKCAGNPDILLAPDLEAGNILAKQLTFLANADSAGLVLGAKVPVILTSRADSVRSRIASCAVATLVAHARRSGL